MAGLASSLLPTQFLTAYSLTSLHPYPSQIPTDTHRYSQILTALHSSTVLSLLHPTLPSVTPILSPLQILINTHNLLTGFHRATSSLPSPFYQLIYISLFSLTAPHKSSHILTPQARLVIVAGLAFHLPGPYTSPHTPALLLCFVGPACHCGRSSLQLPRLSFRHGLPLWLVPPLSYLRLFIPIGPANHCGWSRHLLLTTLPPLY